MNDGVWSIVNPLFSGKMPLIATVKFSTSSSLMVSLMILNLPHALFANVGNIVRIPRVL